LKLTNRLNLPASIVSAVANDPYKGGGDISVTKLIQPAYLGQLLRGMGGEREADAADQIWALMGQIGHSILERVTIDPATSVAEERLYRDVAAPYGAGVKGFRVVKVSGQFDLIENHSLMDFKFTSVYGAGGKKEWEQQLNLLAALCTGKFLLTGDERYRVDKAQIVAVFRDWQKVKVGTRADYPTSQVAVIPVRLWPYEQQLEFMQERVAQHYSDAPAPCTDEERWATEEVYAVMKKGRKTAVKLFDRQDLAEVFAANKGKDHMVIHRPRQFKRCEAYCAAAGACPVWQKQLKQVPF
jgi:hypothetical protein